MNLNEIPNEKQRKKVELINKIKNLVRILEKELDRCSIILLKMKPKIQE